MLFPNIPQYLCVYELNNEINLVVLQAKNSDTAELFALLRSMEESSDYSFGKILDVSEVDPTHHISLTIH
tara:strand:+ start:215 stop:424 length:210 start_codon:yes stop_codon:yes gene_type:complete